MKELQPLDGSLAEEESGPDLSEYLGILKRRKWQLIVPIVLLAPVAVVAALMLPAVYRSSATILIEQQEIPPELIRTTVTSFADQRIQVIKQRVMTVENLGRIIEKYGLYREIRRKQSLNAAVATMRGKIGLDMINAQVVDPRSGSAKKATIAFSLSFTDESPAATQKVTNELVSLFMAENLRQREEAVEEASDFLRGEADRLAGEIGALEAALARFKKEHRDNLPELFSLNRELMGRAEERLRDNALTLRTLEEQQLYLETELSRLDPRLVVSSAGGGISATSPAARLQALEAQYAGIASRYSSSHPDRIAIEREMAALRKEVASSGASALRRQRDELSRSLESARRRYAPEHPDVQVLERRLANVERQIATSDERGSGEAEEQAPAAAENPAYVQLKAQLEGIKLEISTLRQANIALEKQIETYEQRLIEAPNIERDYRSLTRDYDNAVAKFREVKDKQLEAELAQALETKRKAERFTLIEPPVVPDEPVKPNRPAIVLMGIVGAVGAGVGNLALREMMDKGLHSARAVRVVTGTPPLAVIPYIPVAADGRRRARRRTMLAGAAVASIIVAVVAVHLFVMPLDLLWFKLLSRLAA